MMLQLQKLQIGKRALLMARWRFRSGHRSLGMAAGLCVTKIRRLMQNHATYASKYGRRVRIVTHKTLDSPTQGFGV